MTFAPIRSIKTQPTATAFFFVLGVVLCFARLLPSQTITTKLSTQDLLQAMASGSDLRGVTSRPWHLKLEVTLFNEKGVNPTTGTIERWQAGENHRTVYGFGSSTRTELKVDGKSYYSSAGDPLLDIVDEVLEGFLHPGPQAFDIEGATPERRTQNFGKQAFDCIMLSQPLHFSKAVPLGMFPTFCANEGLADLRVAYPSGVDILVRQRIGKFLEHHVTAELSIQQGQMERAHANATVLASNVNEPGDYSVTAGLTPVLSDTVRVGAGIIAGSKIAGETPAYPLSARREHIAGTVLLRAVIGVDGRIHSLRVQSTPDPDLAIASLYAVRTWRYKPYLLHGMPTAVDTTITVNFSLN